MVTGAAAQSRRRGWRRAKSRGKLQKSAKDPGQKTLEPDGFPNGDQPDRLLLSALKYWEVEHDLIEERLAAIRRSAAAVS